jgi:hypothetical protein
MTSASLLPLSVIEDISPARKPSLVQGNHLPSIDASHVLQKRYGFEETLNCLPARLLMRLTAT